MKYKQFILIMLLVIINSISFATDREITIEDFEAGEITLYSYPSQDLEPDGWETTTENTFNTFSQFALKLYGNTWKIEEISPVMIAENDIWEIACFIEDKGEIQGIGFGDGTNELFYSIDGSEMVNIEEWIPVNQGAFEEGVWNIIQLPIADDWFSWFEYYPQITKLIFVNDNDGGSGIVYFDNIYDIA